jgi:hypothetical protein
VAHGAEFISERLEHGQRLALGLTRGLSRRLMLDRCHRLGRLRYGRVATSDDDNSETGLLNLSPTWNSSRPRRSALSRSRPTRAPRCAEIYAFPAKKDDITKHREFFEKLMQAALR